MARVRVRASDLLRLRLRSELLLVRLVDVRVLQVRGQPVDRRLDVAVGRAHLGKGGAGVRAGWGVGLRSGSGSAQG